jgi:hypothetical protein
MLKVIWRVFCLAALTLIALGSVASALDTVRIRGTIEKVDGAVYVVKSRDGSELKVSLTDNPLFVAIVKASPSDIKQGSFIGATGMPQPDGSQKAIEVHIFPESMRGTGEGHYAWDLQPQSTMTNANVEQTVAGVDGQTLTVKHKLAALCGEKQHQSNGGSASTTEVSICRSGIVQYILSNAALRSDETSAKPWRR